MKFSTENGALRVDGLATYSISVHWSFLLGAFVFSNFSFAPGFWIGIFILILCHELGHAGLIRYFRGDVLGILIHAFGGECRWQGGTTYKQNCIIAWGGVLAQGAILLLTGIFLLIFGWPYGWLAHQVLSAFLFSNALLIIINLLPFAALDGGLAWKLPGILRREREARRRKEQQTALVKKHQEMLKKQDGPVEVDGKVIDFLQKVAERSKKSNRK